MSAVEQFQNMRILHITAHVGGGIGAAFAGLGDCGQEQSILLLEPPIDQNTLSRVEQAGFRIVRDLSAAGTELRRADVVVFSWFHHPVLSEFLHDFPQIPIRSVFWSHVSGNYFPHLSAALLAGFDQIMFTTPFSRELPQVQALGKRFLEERCQIVYGLNDLSNFPELRRKRKPPFTIGYAGTLGFCKLHPAFVDFCAEAAIPGARFLLVGSPSTKKELLSAAAQKGIAEQFLFSGHVPDITQAFSKMDVFGYLLNPQHYGTTENVLLEAMAAGLPVVALKQCVEQKIIKDGVSGLLVRSPEEYGNAIRYLYENPQKADALGAQARKEVQTEFSIRENRRRFLRACGKALCAPKRIPSLSLFSSPEPSDWFLAGVGKEQERFEKNDLQNIGFIFREPTKGSPFHYASYFPEDKRFEQWLPQLRGVRMQVDYAKMTREKAV